jgi:hypothetical protein
MIDAKRSEAVMREIAAATGTIVPYARDAIDYLLLHHDARTKELLEANNRLVEERREVAEHLADAMARNGRMARMMANMSHGVQQGEDRPYTGIILPGMGFIWEPTLPYAREALVVVEVGNTKVKTISQTAIGSDEEAIRHSKSMAVRAERAGGTWNEIARFREAVVRCPMLDEVRT